MKFNIDRAFAYEYKYLLSYYTENVQVLLPQIIYHFLDEPIYQARLHSGRDRAIRATNFTP